MLEETVTNVRIECTAMYKLKKKPHPPPFKLAVSVST